MLSTSSDQRLNVASNSHHWVKEKKKQPTKRCFSITPFADFRLKMLHWITSGLVTEPQPSPNDLACQCRLYITTSISSTDGWTSTDLTALYGPEGLAVFLTWHEERMGPRDEVQIRLPWWRQKIPSSCQWWKGTRWFFQICGCFESMNQKLRIFTWFSSFSK